MVDEISMPIKEKDRKDIEAIISSACSGRDTCPIKDVLASFGDKWSLHVLLSLGQQQQLRFNALRASIYGISQRMLTVTLRSLQRDGLVCRVHAEESSRAEYRLTELGESLLKQLLPLAKWAESNLKQVMKARKQYERNLHKPQNKNIGDT